MNKERFNDLLMAMILCESGISDLLFVPGRVPQMSCYGKLRSYTSDLATEPFTAEMTAQLAEIIMDGNALVAENYRKNGSCDCSYAVPAWRVSGSTSIRAVEIGRSRCASSPTRSRNCRI